MKKVIVGKSKGLEDAEQCDIHVVTKRFVLLKGKAGHVFWTTKFDNQ